MSVAVDHKWDSPKAYNMVASSIKEFQRVFGASKVLHLIPEEQT